MVRMLRTQPQEYMLATVSFGKTLATYLFVTILHQFMDNESTRYPVAAKHTKENFYIDNLLSGAETR